MPRPLVLALLDARGVLLLSQQGLADLVGSSLRTVQRWETQGSSPAPFHLNRLADAVEARNPALAAELDLWAPRPKPPAPPPPPPVAAVEPPVAIVAPPAPAPKVPTHVLIDSVLCAGAEAISVTPQALRPALRAALLRASEAGLRVEDLVAGLVGGPSSVG